MTESTTKRATIYLETTLHRALRKKSEETDRSISDLVNDAVREAIAEDADDLVAIEARKNEPSRSFRTFVAELRKRGNA